MKTADFDFHLPPDRIATHPAEPRDAAKLLHIVTESSKQPFSDHIFRDLPDLLSPGDLLVVNDSKVIPARLYGKRENVSIELLLHKPIHLSQWERSKLAKPISGEGVIWRAFLRPAKRVKINDTIILSEELHANVLDKYEGGEALLQFTSRSASTNGLLDDEQFFSILSRIGHMPLPPYIKREDEASDEQDYQTVYALHPGSVAAPTAGLHFTPELLTRLQARGIDMVRVTLHVGAGTFLPVKVEDIHQHVMHSEWAQVTTETATAINRVRAEGGRIVAVGTTALRTLESAADAQGLVHPFHGETDIFITPGYRFRAVDRLITNFHLPQSTLFMLVSAFSGLARMQAAYAHAIAQGYRFYSYGDACLLDRVRSSEFGVQP